VNVHFRKIGRGPAWERWLIIEDQHGDTAFAGEVIVTYSDVSGFADTECDILFARELTDEEVEDLLKAVIDILSGQGDVTIFTARQVICKGFSLLGEDEDDFEDEELEDLD